MKRRISKLKILYVFSSITLIMLISVFLVSLFFKNNKVYAVDFEKNNTPYSSDQTTISSSEASTNYVSMTTASNGSTTSDYSQNVITISTPQELILFSKKCDPLDSSYYNEAFLGYKYKLLCSIDFEGVSSDKFVPIGYQTAFGGEFDGNGFEILHLPLIALTTADANSIKYWYSDETGAAGDNGIRYFAMFSQNSGTLKNFGLVSPEITISYVPKGEAYIAPVCGVNTGNISNVYHKMLDSLEENSTGIYSQGGFFISGFASINKDQGKIENIYSAVSIISQKVSTEILTQAEILNVNSASVSNAYFYDSTIISYQGANTSGSNSGVSIKFNPSYVTNDISNTTSIGMYSNSLDTMSKEVSKNCSAYYYLDSYDESIQDYFKENKTFYYTTPILRGIKSYNTSSSAFTITNELEFAYMFELFEINKNFATSKFTYNISNDINMAEIAAPTYSSNIGATITSNNTSNVKIYNAPISNYHATNLGFDAYGLFPWVTGSISNIDVILGSESSAYNITFVDSLNRKVVGALVGYLDGGSIQNCNVYLNVSLSSDAYYLGGIAGMMGSSSNVVSSIKDSTVNGTISEKNSESTSIVTNTNYLNSNIIGGVAGYIDYTTGSLDTVLSTLNINAFGNANSSYVIGGVLGAGYVNTLKEVQFGQYSDNTLTGGITLGDSTNAMSYSSLYLSGVVGRLLGITNQVDSITNYGSLSIYQSTNDTYISGIMNVDIIKNATSYLPVSSNPLNNKGEYLFYASALSNDANISINNKGSKNSYYTYGVNVNSANGFTSKIGGLYNLKKKNKDDISIDMASIYSFASLINNISESNIIDVETAYNFKNITFTTTSEIEESTTLKYSGAILGGYATLSDVHNVGDLTFSPVHNITSNIIAVGIIDEVSENNTINNIYNKGDITLDSNVVIEGDIYFSGICYKNNHEYSSQKLSEYNPSNANFNSKLTGSINNTINKGEIKVTNSKYGDITFSITGKLSTNGQQLIGTTYTLNNIPTGYVKGGIYLSGIVSKNESVITNTFNLGDVTAVNNTSENGYLYSSGISVFNITNSSYILNSANNGSVKALNISSEITAKAYASGISVRNDITDSNATISGASGHANQIISFTINYGSVFAYNYAAGISSSADEPRTNASGVLSFGLCNIINTVNYGNIYSSETTSGIFGVVYFKNYEDDAKNNIINITNSINYGNIYVLDKGNNLYNSTDSYLMDYNTFISASDSTINNQSTIKGVNAPLSNDLSGNITYSSKDITPVYAKTSITTVENLTYFIGSIFSLVNFNGSSYANNIRIRYLISFNEDVKIVSYESNTPLSENFDTSKIYSSYLKYDSGSYNFSTYMGKNVTYAPLSDNSETIENKEYIGIFSSSFEFRKAIEGDLSLVDIKTYPTDAFLSDYFEFVSYKYVNSTLMNKIGWKSLVYIDAANSFASDLEGVYKFFNMIKGISTTTYSYSTDVTSALKTSTWSSYASEDVLKTLVEKLIDDKDIDSAKTLISYLFSSENTNSTLITNTFRSNILEYILNQDKYSDILNSDILGFNNYFSKTLADYLCDGDNEISVSVEEAIENYIASTSTATRKELLLAYVDYLKSNGDAFFEYTTTTSKYDLLVSLFNSIDDDSFYSTLLGLFSQTNQSIINNVSSFDETLQQYGGYQTLSETEKVELFTTIFSQNDEDKISTYLTTFATEIGIYEKLIANGFQISSFDDTISSVKSSSTTVSQNVLENRIKLWNQIRNTYTFKTYLDTLLSSKTLYFKATEYNNTYRSDTAPNNSANTNVNMAYSYAENITPSTYFYGPYNNASGGIYSSSSSLSNYNSSTSADFSSSSGSNGRYNVFITTNEDLAKTYVSAGKINAYATFLYEYGVDGANNQFTKPGAGLYTNAPSINSKLDSSYKYPSDFTGTKLNGGYIKIDDTVVSLEGGSVSSIYLTSGNANFSSVDETAGQYILYDKNNNEYLIKDNSYYLCDASGNKISGYDSAMNIKSWYYLYSNYGVKYYIACTTNSFNSESNNTNKSGIILYWDASKWITQKTSNTASVTSQYIIYDTLDLISLDGYLTSYGDGSTISDDERSIISSLFDSYFINDSRFSNIVKKALFESSVNTNYSYTQVSSELSDVSSYYNITFTTSTSYSTSDSYFVRSGSGSQDDPYKYTKVSSHLVNSSNYSNYYIASSITKASGVYSSTTTYYSLDIDVSYIDKIFISNINSSNTIETQSDTTTIKQAPLEYLAYDTSTTIASYLKTKFTSSSDISNKDKIITSASSNILVFSELLEILFDVSKTYEGSNDIGYGGTLNFLEIMNRLKLMKDNSWSTPELTSWSGLESNSSAQLAKYQYIPLSISNTIDSSYYSSNTMETISSSNIGFFVGNESKIANRNVSALTKNVYAYTGSNLGVIASSTSNTSLDKDIYDTLFNSLLTQSKVYGVRFNKQIDVNNWVEIDGTNIAGLTNQNITVPQNTVWFAAQTSGTAKIVLCGESASKLTRGIALYVINRTSTDSSYKYYSALTNSKTNSSGYGSASAYGGVSNITTTLISSAYKNTYSDGSIDYTYNSSGSGASQSECVYDYNWYTINSGDASQNAFVYLEIPLIEGYEYAFGQQNDGEGMVLYMDIGQNATSTTDTYKNVQGALSDVDDATLNNLIRYLVPLEGKRDTSKYAIVKSLLKEVSSYNQYSDYYTRSGSGTSDDPYIYNKKTASESDYAYYESPMIRAYGYTKGLIYYTKVVSGTNVSYNIDANVDSNTDFISNEYYTKDTFITLRDYMDGVDIYKKEEKTSGTQTLDVYTKTSFSSITDYANYYVGVFTDASQMTYDSSKSYYSYSDGVYTKVSSPSTTNLRGYYTATLVALEEYLLNLTCYTYDETIGYTMVSGTNYTSYYVFSSSNTIKNYQDVLFSKDFYKLLVTNSNESMSNLLAYLAGLDNTEVSDLNNIIYEMVGESSYIFDSIVTKYQDSLSDEFKQYLVSAYVISDYANNKNDLTNTILYNRLTLLDENYQYISESGVIDNDKFDAFAEYIGYNISFNFGIFALASSSGIKDGTFIPDNLVLSSMDPYYNSSYEILNNTSSDWRGGEDSSEGSVNYAFNTDMKQLLKSISTTIIEITLIDESNNIYYASSNQIVDGNINFYFTSVPSNLKISSLTIANKATSSMNIGDAVSNNSNITITAEDTTVSKTYTFVLNILSASITSFKYDDNTISKTIDSTGSDIVINLESNLVSNIDLKPYITISNGSTVYNYLNNNFASYFSYYSLGNYQITNNEGSATIKFKVLQTLPGGTYTITLNICGAQESLELIKTKSSEASITTLEFDNKELSATSNAFTSSVLFGRVFNKEDLTVESGDYTTVPGYLSAFSISTNATYTLSYITSIDEKGLLSYVLTYILTAEDGTQNTYTHTIKEVDPYEVDDAVATIYKDGNAFSSVKLSQSNEYTNSTLNGNTYSSGYVYATDDDKINLSFTRNEGAPTYRVYFNLSNFYTINKTYIYYETTSNSNKGLSSMEDSYAGLTLTITSNCDTGEYTFEYVYTSKTLDLIDRIYKFPTISITKSASTDSLINNITFLDNLSSIGASATKINPGYALVVNETADNNSEYDNLGTNEKYYQTFNNSAVSINASGDLTYTTSNDKAGMNYYILGSVSDATLSDYAPTMKINEYSEIYQYTTSSKLTSYGSSQTLSDTSVLKTSATDSMYLYVPFYVGDSEEAATSSTVFLVKMEVSATGVKSLTGVYTTSGEFIQQLSGYTLSTIHNVSFTYDDGSTYKVSSSAGAAGNASLNMDYIGDPLDGHFWYVSYAVFSEAYIKDSNIENVNFYHISIVDLTNNVYFTIKVNVPESFVFEATAIYITISYVTYDENGKETNTMSVYAAKPDDANEDGSYTFETMYSLSMLPSGYFIFYLELPHGYSVTYSAYRNNKIIDNNLTNAEHAPENTGSFVPPSSIVPQQIDLVFNVESSQSSNTSTWGVGSESTTTCVAEFKKTTE